ncbi:hypothetical protein BURK1_01413 [Burkholderiales bacterium]|nr:hypothetical protein BURK1_01413 [Burkholderiales bacterium]
MNASHFRATHPTQRLRRAIAFAVALLLASLAFGVGLPWIIVEAPPETETLWAREVQSRAPAATPVAMPAVMRPVSLRVPR